MAECECGERLFLGETICPNCRAKRRSVPEGVGDPSVPLDGANLLVRKGLSDSQIGVERSATDGYARAAGMVGMVTGFGGGVVDPEATIDDIARVMKPQRDAQGKVIWDWKNALVGGIVVAVVVGVIVFWIVYRLGAYGIDVRPKP